MKFDLKASALMCASAFAFAETESQASSYYNPGTEVKAEIAFSNEAIQQLYYNYYYGTYAYDGPTIAVIIFLEILLPITVLVLSIIGIVRLVRARRHRHGGLYVVHRNVHYDVHPGHPNEHLVAHTA